MTVFFKTGSRKLFAGTGFKGSSLPLLYPRWPSLPLAELLSLQWVGPLREIDLGNPFVWAGPQACFLCTEILETAVARQVLVVRVSLMEVAGGRPSGRDHRGGGHLVNSQATGTGRGVAGPILDPTV